MAEESKSDERFEGMSAAAQLRLRLPEIAKRAGLYRSHPAIIAELAESGLVISIATLRKELARYRREVAEGRDGPQPVNIGGADGRPAPAVSESPPPTPAPDRLEQPVNQTPTPAATTAQPLSVLSGVLDPKRRSSVADEFMHVHERPRLGRKKAEQ